MNSWGQRLADAWAAVMWRHVTVIAATRQRDRDALVFWDGEWLSWLMIAGQSGGAEVVSGYSTWSCGMALAFAVAAGFVFSAACNVAASVTL